MLIDDAIELAIDAAGPGDFIGGDHTGRSAPGSAAFVARVAAVKTAYQRLWKCRRMWPVRGSGQTVRGYGVNGTVNEANEAPREAEDSEAGVTVGFFSVPARVPVTFHDWVHSALPLT